MDAHYIQTALTLLGEVELLNSLKIESVGIKDGKGTRSGGKNGLNNFRNIYEANASLFSSPILLLYDCDTNKEETNSGRLWVRLIPENTENAKVKKGIENLFPENLFRDCFYFKDFKDDGGYLKLLDKKKLCLWICEDRRDPGDFEGFKKVVKILKQFVEAHRSQFD